MANIPRIVPPEEIQAWQGWSTPFEAEVAHTAAVLCEQREAVLALHRKDDDGYCVVCVEWSRMTPAQAVDWPCPTTLALGVSDD